MWPAGKWLHVKETTEIGEGKMFSPGDRRLRLRAAICNCC